MTVTVFHHPRADDGVVAQVSLDRLSRQQVTVDPAWTVADVLSAAGADPYMTFVLVDPEIESDISRGESRSISASFNLLGLDDSGAIHYQLGQHVSWRDFRRAVDAGLFSGDPTRIVTYPYGAAGGPIPDGLAEIVQFLFEHREEIEAMAASLVAGTTWITSRRRRAIADQWREQGFTASRINELLAKYPQWDPEVFATRTTITVTEARLAMTNAGYEAGPDGLWRPGDLSESRTRQQRRAEIERKAEAEPY